MDRTARRFAGKSRGPFGRTACGSIRATAAVFAELARRGAFDLPRPGGGATVSRLKALAELAAGDLSVARLGEGHADAVAILDEAGRRASSHSAYGVWAAKSNHAALRAEAASDGWVLTGTTPFCSGARDCDRALVTASDGSHQLLFDIAVHQPEITVVDGTWPALGMAGSDSLTVNFDHLHVAGHDVVGPPDFYLTRPGFWHGGVGVAACWYGGARAAIEATAAVAGRAGDAELAQLSGAVARVKAMWALLAQAADEIDGDPRDRDRGACSRALSVRHFVYLASMDVLTAINGAGGARPLSLDADQSRRVADLYVYLSQHHPGRDGAELGRLYVQAHTQG